MKQQLLIQFLRKLKTNPGLRRKVKIFAIVGLAGFIMTGILAAWVAVSAFNYVSSTTIGAIQSEAAQNHVDNIKAEFKGLSALQVATCWAQAQSLMAVQPWLERSMSENLARLKVACLENKPKECIDAKCESPLKTMIKTYEGSSI
jgi:hypothetical protein